MKMSSLSRPSRVLIIAVLVAVFCMQSYGDVAFYRVGPYVRSRFSGELRFTKFWSKILEYGPTFPDPPKGFDGMVVLADPSDGCQPIAPPPNNTYNNPIGKWVAFMKFGNCSVLVKTRNAQNANYHMALLDNIGPIIRTGMTDDDRKANTSDIKINTVVLMTLGGRFIRSEGTYRDHVVMNVMKDEGPGNQVLCKNIYENGTSTIKCNKQYTGEPIPLPDIWTV